MCAKKTQAKPNEKKENNLKTQTIKQKRKFRPKEKQLSENNKKKSIENTMEKIDIKSLEELAKSSPAKLLALEKVILANNKFTETKKAKYIGFFDIFMICITTVYISKLSDIAIESLQKFIEKKIDEDSESNR